MLDSVPGPDVIYLTPPAEGIPDPSDAARYAGVLAADFDAVRGGFQGRTRRLAIFSRPRSRRPAG